MATIKDVKVTLRADRADDEEIICDTMTINLKTKTPENLIEIAFGRDKVVGARSCDSYLSYKCKYRHIEHTSAAFSTDKYFETLKKIKETDRGAAKSQARITLNSEFTDYLYKTVISILWELGVSKPKDSKMFIKLYNMCKGLAEYYLDWGKPKAYVGASLCGLNIEEIETREVNDTARYRVIDFLEKAYQSSDEHDSTETSGAIKSTATHNENNTTDSNVLCKQYSDNIFEKHVSEEIAGIVSKNTGVFQLEVLDVINYIRSNSEDAYTRSEMVSVYENMMNAFSNNMTGPLAEVTKRVNSIMRSESNRSLTVKVIISKWLGMRCRGYREANTKDERNKYIKAICLYIALAASAMENRNNLID